MEKISIKHRLPKDNQYVLIHLTNDNLEDSDDHDGKIYWRVAKFIKGISEEDRDRMRRGEIEDVSKICYSYDDKVRIEHKYKRSDLYEEGDEDGNNTVPYGWDERGEDFHFGQDVDFWCELPDGR